MKKAIALFEKQITGSMLFLQNSKEDLVTIDIHLSGFKPYSIHAIHIHEYGDTRESFNSFGEHFNPHQTNHGRCQDSIHHAGDLFNNLIADQYGNFDYQFNTNELSLYDDIKNIIGRSVVIHQFEDDLGQMGVIQWNKLISYKHMTSSQLRKLCISRDYHCKDLGEMITRLQDESLITGNSGSQIAYGIIVLCKS